MLCSSGLASLLLSYQLFQWTDSSLFSTTTYDPLIKSVILEAFGSGGKGKMVVGGERGLQVEAGPRQPFFQKSVKRVGLKITNLAAQKLEAVVTHTSVQSLTFCPGEGSNMLTFKLFQLSLIDTARTNIELVTVVPHFYSYLINIQSCVQLFSPLVPMVCAHMDLEVTFSICL